MVLDRTTGAEVTRLAFARAPDTFDVQADGTVAVAERLGPDGAEDRLGARGRDRAAHARRADAALGLSLAGDRVAYARATSAGAAEIVVQALDGPFVPASFPIATPTGFDFDGTRVAFASSECVYTALADGVPAGGATPAGPCPRAKTLVRPAAPSVALTRRKRAVRVRLACPMAGDDGCRGRVVLTYTRRNGRPARLVRRAFRLARGTERKVTLRVAKRLVRALRAAAREPARHRGADGRRGRAASRSPAIRSASTRPKRGRAERGLTRRLHTRYGRRGHTEYGGCMSVKRGLLALLVEGPRYGAELKTEFERRTGGTWPLNIGQVYTTLARLQRDGLVAAAGEDEQRRPRYAVTDVGPRRGRGMVGGAGRARGARRATSWRSSSPSRSRCPAWTCAR